MKGHREVGDSIMVSDWVHEWLERYATPVSPIWARTRRSLLNKHVLPALGEVRIAELTPAHLDDLLHHTAGLSKSSRHKLVHGALRACLRTAVIRGVMRADHFAELYARIRPLRVDGRGDPHPFTPARRDEILEVIRRTWASERPDWYLFTRWQFMTGTRPSEAMGLQAGCLDRGQSTAFITRGWVEGYWTELKTARSRRWIDVPPQIMAEIPKMPDGHRVFGSVGTLKHYRDAVWYPALNQVGITKTLERRFYNTRATAAVSLLLAGVPVVRVAAQLGDRVETVETWYAQIRNTPGIGRNQWR